MWRKILGKKDVPKKSSPLNGRAIKAYTPPPLSSLMFTGTLERWKKKVQKKFFNGPALYILPPPLNGLAIKRRTFFRLP